MKKSNFKKNISKGENMFYDEINDEYICHNSKALKNVGKTTRKSASGYKSEITLYECENWKGYFT